MSTQRDYAGALAKLAQLQSNRTVTHLFGHKTTANDSSHDQQQQQQQSPIRAPAARDLNAAAIPEMLQWLRRAGYSTRDLARMRHIHVAGTKGKGSVCAFATSMLRRHVGGGGGGGRPVGTYTSPHLVSPRERIAIDGEPISQAQFATAFFELWDRFTASAAARESGGASVAEAEGPASKPFYFRFLTILAWHVFLQEGVRDVVMECGIGGEYDATNVLPPDAVSAAVITQLGIDHVAMLGDTAEEIAWHKAGILKDGVPAFTVTGGRQLSTSGVRAVLRQRALDKNARLVELDADEVAAWGGVPAPAMKGEYQKANQALAVMAVRAHLGQELDTSLLNLPETTVKGLQEATLRGRCEVLVHNGFTWLLDGAHTKESLEEVAKWVAQQQTRTEEDGEEQVILVFNQQERNASVLLRTLVEAVDRECGRRGIFSHALFTRNEPTADAVRRELSVQEAALSTMRGLCPGCEVAVFDNVMDAVSRAERLVARGSRSKVLVTGSLHLVGGALQVLEPDTLL